MMARVRASTFDKTLQPGRRQYRIGSNLGVLAFALLFYSGQRQLRPVISLIHYGGHCNLRCHGVGLLAHEWELVPDNVTARVYQ